MRRAERSGETLPPALTMHQGLVGALLMTTLPGTPPTVKSTSRPRPKVCRLTIRVDGTAYVVFPVEPAPGQPRIRTFVVSEKPDGVAHAVIRTAEGGQCSCPDSRYGEPTPCTHIRALVAAGVLDFPVQASPDEAAIGKARTGSPSTSPTTGGTTR